MTHVQKKPFVVYILRTSANTLYIGQTNDLEKRMRIHSSKSAKSAKYLRYFDSFELVYTEKANNKSEALKREAKLKKFTRLQKEELIASQTS